ncbi:hybrid sensor histidine kinase/response regulator transcription factor [Saccharobesus litoralis]|nr:hybrid sensor histidine kinase/response regulator transcription factor [Saccharobesus litoralis]
MLVFACSLHAKTIYKPKIPSVLANPAKWHVIEAIPSRLVKNLDFDANSQLWIASIEGVMFYDGYTLTKFGIEHGIETSEFRLVKVARNGAVYAIAKNAIYKYDGTNWQALMQGTPLYSNKTEYYINDGHEDKLGAIWFAAESKIVRIYQDQVSLFDTEHQWISSLAIDHLGDIWLLGGQTGTVSRYSVHEGAVHLKRQWPQLMRSKHAKEIGFNGHITQLSDLSMWVMNREYSSATRRLKVGESRWHPVKLPHHVRSQGQNHSLFETASGDYILPAGKQILFSQDKGLTWQQQDYEQHRITGDFDGVTFKQSPDGHIWLIEPGASIKRFPDNHTNPKVYQDLLFQCEAPNGDDFFLSNQNQLVQFSEQKKLWYAFDSSDNIIQYPSSVLCDSQGHIWVAGSHNQQAAISYFNGHIWRQYFYPEFGKSIHYLSPIEGKNNKFYFGSNDDKRDLELYKSTLLEITKTPNGLRDKLFEIDYHKVSNIIVLDDNQLILNGHRLRQYNNYQFKSLKLPLELKTGWIDDVIIDDNQHILSATWGGGLIKYNGKQWSSINRSNGFLTNKISNLLKLQQGHYLALTDVGAVKFDGQRWFAIDLPYATGERRGRTLKQSQDGAIWVSFFNTNWIYRKDYPDTKNFGLKTIRYQLNSKAPNTLVNIKQKQQEYNQSIYLAWHGQDYLSETPTAKLEYSFRLIDRQNDNSEQELAHWSEFSFDTSQLFNNLPAGEYNIEVKARDSHGNIDPTPAALAFTIVQPFWQTLWFKALIILFPIVIAGLIIALLVQRVRHISVLDKARLKFLTNISHELRTPLSLVIGPLEKLAREQLANGADNQTVDLALNNAIRLNELVDQLLDYRKSQSGHLMLLPKTCELVSFCKMICANFSNIAEHKQQSIQFHCDTTEFLCQIDQDALRKIIENLISNAVKYSPNGSDISINLSFGSNTKSKLPLEILFSVTDQGEGIPKDQVKEIFDPFYTCHRTLGSKQVSFGVGLALVKELVELLGGSIKVTSPVHTKHDKEENAQPEFGSCFTVRIPTQRFASQQTEIKIDESELNDLENSNKPVVLLIEDQPELGQFIQSELQDDYKVIWAKNGSEGFEIANKIAPDIIVSDIIMPGELDGIQLCHRLKQNLATSHIPVILQTSLSSKESEQQGLSYGAIDYLQKPVSTELLKIKINNHIESLKTVAQSVEHKLNLVRQSNISSASSLSSHNANNNGTNNGNQSTQRESNHAATGDDLDAASPITLSFEEQQFIERFQAIIDNNYEHSGFNAEKLALEMGISKSAFYRKFKAITNTSPADYIRDFRLDKAKYLLSQQDCAIKSVALQIGYTEQSPFYRAFKKRFACTPSEFRTSVLKQTN